MTIGMKTSGDLREEITKRHDEVLENATAGSVESVRQMLDSVMDYYLNKMGEVPKESLPDIQIAFKQTKAIRQALSDADKRPTIF